VLIGGEGADVFVWVSRSDMHRTATNERFTDVISDFDITTDKLDMRGLMETAKGDKSLPFQLDETDLGTTLKVNMGRTHGWFDLVMLENVKLSDATSVSADWLLV
jgi:Ca2+-binding RTX toxin-like protein